MLGTMRRNITSRPMPILEVSSFRPKRCRHNWSMYLNRVNTNRSCAPWIKSSRRQSMSTSSSRQTTPTSAPSTNSSGSSSSSSSLSSPSTPWQSSHKVHFNIFLVLQIFALMISLCLMLFIIVYNCHRFKQEIIYISLIDRINIKIMDFFSYLNSRVGTKFQWKTEKNLYWL